MVNRVRSLSAASQGSRPETLLPTIATDPTELDSDVTPMIMQSPSFRKHSRKRSSTVYIAPRQTSPPSSSAAEKPVAVSQRRLASLFSGVGALAGAQALTKLMTFFVNQIVMRFIDAREFGASAQLEFVGISVLSLARDAVRFASQRQTLSHSHADEYRVDGTAVHGTRSGTIQETINLAYCSIAIGVPLAIFMACFMVHASDGSSISIVSAVMYGAASIFELAAEPCFLINQLQMNLRARAQVEALSAVSRTLVTFLLIVGAHSPAVFAFASGQLTYAVVYCIAFYLQSLSEFREGTFKMYLCKVWAPIGNDKAYLDTQISKRALGMGAQTMLKYFLTESDRLLVSLMISLEQQGIYALASNYGSLLARLVLFPVEEALRALFSKSLPQKGCSEDNENTSKSPTPTIKIEPISPSFQLHTVNGSKTEEEEKEETNEVNLAVLVLTTVLRVYLYIGLAAWALGPHVAPYLLSLLVSSRWAASDASKVLAAYMMYIPFLALNGALEAFVQSTASLKVLRKQSSAMVFIAIAFVVVSYIFMLVMNLGAVGLVWAQVVTMSLRILWAIWYARDYFANETQVGQWIPNALPSPLPVGFAAVITGIVVNQGTVKDLGQLLVAATLGIAFVAVTVYAERDSIRKIKTLAGSTKESKAE
ncbi:Oligosaccharide translocation protein RFT1 [Wickerhamiella sorbophila]|uniref:Man(5)GlcNAc(2)-PP-dolichol translocation protein RFT1 n=1 Tax=Wickerhamiella sorbophila TaxID=45607 RepID=A0A2T0FDY6_9ASCO|nr:Oligosaccharide translocation protein RFT1 [Wickerhamiella sorbophila]PRT53149.1 Oligosaccharide translocation protein RFT1 [Wickerhamiella sorbophila]